MDRHLKILQKLAYFSPDDKDRYIAALERALYVSPSVGNDYAELCHAINDSIEEIASRIEKEGLRVGPHGEPSYDPATYCYNIFLELERTEEHIMGVALGHVLSFGDGLQRIYAPDTETFEQGEDYTKEFIAVAGQKREHTGLRNIYLWYVL
jgi:hypothetical protein